ncbi:glycoside hydrolase family 3 C-terminal domain-containing protein [Streptomonospora nanhaiensis]|uniref:Exo-alpha-(1->6)-L-arabinopyranosidase n=1 Tax=Streptomonospora nanhaiensis TaxID=1323731 RepID=A0A853BND1_9ACTN|nr:glycoside hydrolase family 3 C-terminal domain-containing protein [Streptomonospora nanhaiensis]NYI96254.1 beta-glucosidase [Streptomonospora nanhaiensis]
MNPSIPHRPPAPSAPAAGPRRARRGRSRWAAAALAAALAAGLVSAVPGAASADTGTFRDPDLPLDTRVEDLLGRLTRAEKIAMLHQYQPAVPRLDIGPFRTGTEALHGVAWLGEATVFPQSVGLGGTWDPELVERVGDATGTEMRGFHVQDPAAHGLNVWAPVADPLRDPRWGRNEEGYSEDPTLVGEMATAYTGGLRGDDDFYLKTAPTLKHFAAYNIEADRDRVSVTVPPRALHEYVYPAFRPAIAAGNATGVMAAYNLINGRPAHVTPLLDDVRSWSEHDLMVVSDAYGPSNVANSQGYYDTHAESHAAMLTAGIDSYTDQDTNPSLTVDAVTEALEQGLITEADVDRAVGRSLSVRFRLGEFDPPERNPYSGITPEAIDTPQHRKLAREAALAQMTLLKNDGALPLDPESDTEVAVVGPLADTLYEDWYSGTMPYEVTPADGIAERLGEGGSVATAEGADRVTLTTADGRAVTASAEAGGGVLRAQEAGGGGEDARAISVFEWGEGVVTLRTEANGKVVGLGEGNRLYNDQEQPNGWFVQQLFRMEEVGDGEVVLKYAGYDTWNRKYVSVGEDGALTVDADTPEDAARFRVDTLVSGTDAAVEAVSGADAAVVVVGNMPFINARETDDRESIELPQAQRELVEAVTAANPNTVVVLESSYPQAVPWAQEHVPALLWTSHAGQETGSALAAVLFGDHNPAGRLPQTWYRSTDDLPAMHDYDIIHSGHTYQYFEGDPLYAFGHGLSYSTFEYGKPRLDRRRIGAEGTVTVRVPVTNTGERDGDEVVQLYTHQNRSRVAQPIQELRDFERVHVEAGETVTVELEIDAADLAFWDVTRGREVVETASHDVLIGSSSADIRRRTQIEVKGERIPPRDLTETTRAADFDRYSGIAIADETKADGMAVEGSAGDWIAFDAASLPSRLSGFTAQAARAQEGGAALEIRLGSPEGRLLGTAEVPSTGGKYTYEEVTTALTRPGAGHGDVYLVFTGDLRLSEFALTKR